MYYIWPWLIVDCNCRSSQLSLCCAGKTSIDWETVSRAKHGHEPLLQNNYMQQEDLNERLRDAVLVTAYNKHVYFHQSVAWDQRITNSFTSSIKGAKAQSAFDKGMSQV